MLLRSRSVVPAGTGLTIVALDVLEIGCGTGLLSLQVAPMVHSLTAVDTSAGMISALKSKIATANVTNIHPIELLLENPEDPALGGKKFDLIISHLVLHHIPDLEAILQTMFGCLKPKGRIALTDFERSGPKSRMFHPESKMEGVMRHGITKMEMECVIKEAGFDKVQVCHAFDLEKSVEAEEGAKKTMDFPFLICLGVRKK